MSELLYDATFTCKIKAFLKNFRQNRFLSNFIELFEASRRNTLDFLVKTIRKIFSKGLCNIRTEARKATLDLLGGRKLLKLVCVSPAFNEERTVASVVEKASRYVDEVIVVDDGSTDNTRKKALEAGAIVISHPRNLGKGAALKTGFKIALERGADVIISIDADGQHDPDEIPRLISAMERGNFDIVIGSRFLGDISSMPTPRIFSNTITSSFLRLFFGIPVTDSQSGFRAFKRKVIESVSFSDPRFAAETEILINAKQKGFKIGEVKIKTIYGEEKSKMRIVEDTLRWIKLVTKYLLLSLLRMRRPERPC